MDENPVAIKSFAELQAVFDKFLLLGDREIIKLAMATVIANRICQDPVWVLVVSPSSGGKTEIISSLNKVENIFPISDLTQNTFASGQKRAGKETSLLHKMPNGSIMTFKDFTSMISKNPEARTEIMGQLREIYDKEYTKRTGTGDDIIWRGKVGALAGCTEAIYEYQEDLSAMGDRFIIYSMTQADRLKVARRVLDNQDADIEALRKNIQEAVAAYLKFAFANMNMTLIKLNDKTKEDLLELADFSTIVRSGVIMDWKKGDVRFVPSHEMPMRMAGQMYNLAQSLIAMRTAESKQPSEIDGSLMDDEWKIMRKIAFESIPIKRRIALRVLAQYTGGVTTAGLAVKVGYQSDIVKQWLSQLNGLGVCKREKTGGNQGDKWTLNPRFREIMVKFDGIKVLNETLEEEDVDDDDDEDEIWGQYADKKPKDTPPKPQEGEDEPLDVIDPNLDH